MTNDVSKYRSFFENSADAMLILEDDAFIDCNPATVVMLGYDSKKEIINKPPHELSPKYQPDGSLSLDKAAEMIRIAKECGNHRFEWDHLRKDGTIIPVEVSLTAIENSSGLQLHTVWRDISIRKQAEQTLRNSEERFRMLLNSTAEAIYGLDTNGHCTFCNPACLELLGYESEADLLGKNMHKVVHHHRRDGSVYPEKDCKIFLAIKRGEGFCDDDEVFWRADGSSFDAEYCSFPMYRGEDVIGAVVTFQDITERKKVQAALVEAKDLAEEANKVKSEFLAKVSHEIRTPMAVFMTAIEHLLDVDQDPTRRQVLNLADLSSQRLYILVEEVLDFSKLEDEKMVLEVVPFNLQKCLQDAVNMMQAKAFEKALGLEVHVAPDLPENIQGDEFRLGQILLNLLAKFMSAGTTRTWSSKSRTRVSVSPKTGWKVFLRLSLRPTVPPRANMVAQA
jgi:PAS domain S-box-containing protein